MVTIWFSFFYWIFQILYKAFKIITPYGSFLIETIPHQKIEWLWGNMSGGKGCGLPQYKCAECQQ